MILTLYQFSKKSNSTAIPGSGVTSYSCGEIYPKDKTSLESPVFQIDYNPTGYTYAKWGSYCYYINDIVYSTPIYEVHCMMDYEATYRSAIMSYAPYVSRGIFTNSSLKDDMIPDPYISMSQDIAQRYHGYQQLFSLTSGGCYVVGVSNDTGGIQYYVMDTAELTNLIRFGVSDDNDILNLVAQGIFNPLQYIASCTWYPLSASALSDGSGAQLKVYIGPWEVTTVSNQCFLATDVLVYSGVYTQPTNYYNDFRDYSAGWTDLTIHIMNQTISVDPKHLTGSISARVEVDVISGQSITKLYGVNAGATENALITTIAAQFGVPMPLASPATNVGGTIGSIVSTIANFATENYAGAVSSAVGAVSAASGITNVINGAAGSRAFAILAQNTFIDVIRHASCDSPEARVGYPINKSYILTNLSYAQCMNPSISIAGSEAARNNINATLSSGIWLE